MLGSANNASTHSSVAPVCVPGCPRRLLVVVLLTSAVSGCSQPASIEVDPEMMFLKRKGQQQRMSVVVKDRGGRGIDDAEFSLAALTPQVIAVDTRTGLVTALRSGDGAVLVKAGDVTKTVSVRVQIAVRVDITPTDLVMNLGVSRPMVATVLNDRGDPVVATKPIRWSVSDPSVVSIDRDGVVKTLKEGQVVITAYAGDTRGQTTITVKHERYDPRRGVWHH